MRTYTIEEVNEARLLYDRDPPKIAYLTVVLLIVLIAGVIVWSCVNEKTEIVNATGVVYADGREYYSSSVTGTVGEIVVQEGSSVDIDDVIIRLDSGDLQKQLELYSNLESLYQAYSERYTIAIYNLGRYDTSKSVGSCDANKNPFDPKVDPEFHSIYQVYLDSISRSESEYRSADTLKDEVALAINQSVSQLNSTKLQYQATYNEHNAQRTYYQGIDDAYDKAIDALTEYTVGGTIPSNPFTSSDFLYASFQNVLDSLKEAADDDVKKDIRTSALNNYADLRSQNKLSLDLYSSQASHYGSLVSDYEDMITHLNRFNTSYGVDAVSDNKNPYSASDGRYSIYQSVLDSIDSIHTKHSGDISLKTTRSRVIDQAIAEMTSNRSQYDIQYSQNHDQAEIYRKMISDSEFKAGMDGYVHIMPGLEKGVTVSSGQVLFTISPKLTDENCMIDVVLPSASRSYISEGDEVEISFAGVDGNDYGNIRGTLVSIGSDSTTDPSGNVTYQCKVKADAVHFTDGRGKSVDVIQGMIAQIGIRYEQTTWFDWAVRMLGFD